MEIECCAPPRSPGNRAASNDDMLPSLLLVLGLCATSTVAWPVSGWPWSSTDSQTPLDDGKIGYHDPADGGGRMLDYTTIFWGEPLNVIISGNSHPDVLSHQGLHKYARSIGFAEECLGLHIGDIHSADLGDGEGRKDEQFLGTSPVHSIFPANRALKLRVLPLISIDWRLPRATARQHYFPIWGTCWESLAGGNHFRAWQQRDTGAWFLAVSKEKYVGDHHQIVDDGYNIGRDYLVSRALRKGARVEWKEGLIAEGDEGINHGIAQDGRVAVLTVPYMPW
ncbi:hypothetical protein RhiJN_20427 [Ceratobasidium sp. AG-Ba]|nr:hypothetical protein RhiJN_20427 [Ceratobasidium sp. AG-Ba]